MTAPDRSTRKQSLAEGWEPVHLKGASDPGKLHLKDRKFGSVTLRSCELSASSTQRSTFDDCSFRDIRSFRSLTGSAVFRNCSFRNVACDYTQTFAALFLKCRLEGRIDGPQFGVIAEEPWVKEKHAAAFRKETERLISAAGYCLDVQDAVLANVGFAGEEIARRVIFSPGQCVIYRADDLAARFDRCAAKTLHTPLEAAFVGTVRPGERLALVALQRGDLADRLPEVRNLARAEGIEVVETPLPGG